VLWYVVASTLTLASIYGLVAIGISLTWSSIRMLNLAQGITFAVGGYGAWLTSQQVSQQPLAILTAGILTGAAAGVITCALAFLPLKRQANFLVRSMIVTLALNLLGTEALLQIFGPESKPLPAVFGSGSVSLGGAVLTASQAGTVVASVVILTGMLGWLRLSRQGLQIRALMQDRERASLVGVDVNRTSLAILAVSGALAGLASVLLSQTYFVNPQAGVEPLIKGLIIALLGGLGSIPGAVIAAGLLAFTEALTAVYLGGQYVLMTQFALVILILVFRPRGIAGLIEEVRERE
jgi:branched-chain amino acid transport system permease protein